MIKRFFSHVSSRRVLDALTIAGLIMAGVATANASIISTTSLTLNNPNTGISAHTGPYGTVTIDLLTGAKDATITFQAATNGSTVYLFGDGGTVGVNVNGPYTLGAITVSNSYSGFSSGAPHLPTDGGPGNEDGFGSFNQTINSFDGFTWSSTYVSFNLHNTSGGMWSDASNVLTGNAGGFLAAAHIFVGTLNNDGSVTNANATGFTTDGSGDLEGGPGGPTIPEPMSLAIWGVGLGICSVVGMRRRMQK